MLGSGIIIVLKMLLPFIVIIFSLSAALKALRGYENKSKKKLEVERKKTAKLQKTIDKQNVRLDKLEQTKTDEN
ncbi:hypothetical protein [Sporosarcina aquimarina]|uniref:DUF4083 domain-containing protein n=1 Tax=Sporosarcina aquimarina TaxID=114975 RepID=A0ABU4FUQ7_9BACL|nr:hypothetical protein [Sporosarcina aquimarina]MDW0108456.1 hypothetical protein [Sporosarcina aquimarina]